MSRVAQDLLLLVSRLAQSQDTTNLIPRFVEAASGMVAGASLRAVSYGQERTGEIIPVATASSSFGAIALGTGTGPLGVEVGAACRAAIALLAVVLENASRADHLRQVLGEHEDFYENAACGFQSLDDA